MSWRNTTIRFTNVGWDPYVGVDRDDFGRKTLTGLTGHMLHFVVKSMGMKYQVTFPNDHEWGTLLPNGSWTGMIGDLTRDEADIAVGPFVMTEGEAIVANPSLPYADENLVIVSGVHKEHETNVYGYITTMDYQVWLLLFGSCLVIMAIVGVMDRVLDPHMTRRQRRNRFWRIFWVYWAAIFLEGSSVKFNRNPHRVMLASWLLGIMVIMHMFIGYMESTLMVKSETFRVNSVDQLLSQPALEPMLFDIGGYKSIIENAESHALKLVMQQVGQHGGLRYGEELFTPPVLRKVLERKAVLLLEPMSLYTRIGPQCKTFRKEGLFHIGKERLLQIKMVFYMRKRLNRKIQAEIQKRVRLIIDSGIFRHWHDTLVFDKGSCWTAEHSDHMHDYADLQVSDLASIFYFFSASLCVSLTVLLVEMLYRKGYCCFCKYKDDEADEMEEKRLIEERMKFDGVYESPCSASNLPALTDPLHARNSMRSVPPMEESYHFYSTPENQINHVVSLTSRPRPLFPGRGAFVIEVASAVRRSSDPQSMQSEGIIISTTPCGNSCGGPGVYPERAIRETSSLTTRRIFTGDERSCDNADHRSMSVSEHAASAVRTPIDVAITQYESVAEAGQSECGYLVEDDHHCAPEKIEAELEEEENSSLAEDDRPTDFDELEESESIPPTRVRNWLIHVEASSSK